MAEKYRRGFGIAVGAIAIVSGGYFLGINPKAFFNSLDSERQEAQAPVAASAAGDVPDQQVDFIRAVLADTEQVWGGYFNSLGRDYAPPKLVLFQDPLPMACGIASPVIGPFYCAADQKIYIDLKFFRQLATQFGGSGALAQAYVIAHEVGHHVQNLLARDAGAHALEGGSTGPLARPLPVELQADCFAGIWAQQANKTRKILEPADLDQGIRAATSVGEDVLQRRERGTEIPESFSYGSDARRMQWFRRGFDAGKIQACDTSGADSAA